MCATGGQYHWESLVAKDCHSSRNMMMNLERRIASSTINLDSSLSDKDLKIGSYSGCSFNSTARLKKLFSSTDSGI
jgi:hypothetical protein